MYRYKDILNLLKDGTINVDGKRCRFRSVEYDVAKEWFRNFVFVSDVKPTTGGKHLPSCLTKKAVYQLYKEEMKKRGEKEIIGKSHFL